MSYVLYGSGIVKVRKNLHVSGPNIIKPYRTVSTSRNHVRIVRLTSRLPRDTRRHIARIWGIVPSTKPTTMRDTTEIYTSAVITALAIADQWNWTSWNWLWHWYLQLDSITRKSTTMWCRQVSYKLTTELHEIYCNNIVKLYSGWEPRKSNKSCRCQDYLEFHMEVLWTNIDNNKHDTDPKKVISINIPGQSHNYLNGRKCLRWAALDQDPTP